MCFSAGYCTKQKVWLYRVIALASLYLYYFKTETHQLLNIVNKLCVVCFWIFRYIYAHTDKSEYLRMFMLDHTNRHELIHTHTHANLQPDLCEVCAAYLQHRALCSPVPVKLGQWDNPRSDVSHI